MRHIDRFVLALLRLCRHWTGACVVLLAFAAIHTQPVVARPSLSFSNAQDLLQRYSLQTPPVVLAPYIPQDLQREAHFNTWVPLLVLFDATADTNLGAFFPESQGTVPQDSPAYAQALADYKQQRLNSWNLGQNLQTEEEHAQLPVLHIKVWGEAALQAIANDPQVLSLQGVALHPLTNTASRADVAQQAHMLNEQADNLRAARATLNKHNDSQTNTPPGSSSTSAPVNSKPSGRQTVAVPQHILTVSKVGAGQARLYSPSHSQIDCSTACQQTSANLAAGRAVTLRAEASSGSSVMGWSGTTCEQGNTTDSCTFSLDASTQVNLLLHGSVAGANVQGTQLASMLGQREQAQDSGMSAGQSKKLAAGFAHTLFIAPNGSLWAWGYNAQGQLGVGNNSNRIWPTQVGTATNWVAVAAGVYHSLGIKSDGTLWAWGLNGFGELGDGTTIARNAPVQVGGATNWAAVAAGSQFSLAIQNTGTLWAFGYNADGQLGNGSNISRNTPGQVGAATDWATLACGDRHGLATKSDGTLFAWGANNTGQLGDGGTTSRNTPGVVGSATNWKALAAGNGYSLGLQVDGTLWAWGTNIAGQLGDGTAIARHTPTRMGTDSNWAAVAAGASHSLAVKSDGMLWAWGENGSGQLGDGTTTHRNSPTNVGTANNWATVAAGYSHTMALKSDGSLWAWGSNNYGQLGDVGTTSQSNPVQIASNHGWTVVAAADEHSLGIRSDGTLWAWGANTDGRLGDGSTVGRDRPVPIGGNASWKAVAAGDQHSLGLKTDGTLWSWGGSPHGCSNGFNVTSSNTVLIPNQVGVAANWHAVASGALHCFAIKNDGSLWAWGNNGNGQLGVGDANNRSDPVQMGTGSDWMSVAAGARHSLAIKSDGTLWAWGSNNFGQLGDASTTDRNTPVQVGSANNWVAIAGGQYHSLAVRRDGTLWAWGVEAHGRLGNGNGSSPQTIQSSPVQVGLGANWAAVSAGNSHSVAIRHDGTLWAWGLSDNGVLGTGSTINSSTPVKVSGSSLWAAVAAGSNHNMGIQSDGNLWGWGYRLYGRLGTHTDSNNLYPQPVGFSATARHTLSVTTPVNGAVRSQPAGIDCGSGNTVCTTTYYGGAVLRLTPVPAANYVFTGWAGACSGSGTCNVTMDAAKSVSATFVAGFMLSVNKAGDGTGTVNSSPAGISCGASCSVGYGSGTSVTLTATPDSGNTFAGWSGACTGTGSCVVTMDAAKTVSATFNIIAPITNALSVSKAGTGTGTVISSPAGINCGATCSASYSSGTSVSLTATADSGSTFNGWSGACTGTGACTVTMDAAKSVTATFSVLPPSTYTLSVSKTGAGAGTVLSTPSGINCGATCSANYSSGTTVTLTATPNSGYVFNLWEGACTGKSSTCTVAVDARKSVTARFDTPQSAKPDITPILMLLLD